MPPSVAPTGRLELILPALDLHPAELDVDELGEATAVDLVVAHEGRRLDANPRRVLTVHWNGPVAAVVVDHRVPEQGLLVRAEVVASCATSSVM